MADDAKRPGSRNMAGGRTTPEDGGEALFGSATSRAVTAERRRLGVSDEHADWTEIWGRRIGRSLAVAAAAALALWLAAVWGRADAQPAGAQPGVGTSAAPLLPGRRAQDDWAKDLTEFDRGRVGRLEESRRTGLEEAAAGEAKDFEAVSSLLGSSPLPIAPERLAGSWRCRTIKLGGSLPLTPYGFFDCRIVSTPEGLVLEKPTGSQRKRGRLARIDDRRLLYFGTSYYSYNEPQPYGSGPDVDEAGVLVQVAPDRLRLELPEPHFESRHDVIELVRRK